MAAGDMSRKLRRLIHTQDKNGYPIKEDIVFGLDIGIASCGWAVLDLKQGAVLRAGTWGFEVPEEPKTRESKAAKRRLARGQRRRLRRRSVRMREIRKLLHKHGLLKSFRSPADIKGQKKPDDDPWQLRAKGLERELSGEEFAIALIHIARHRGFRSNSKADNDTNAPPENKRALSGMASIEEKSARWRTIGEMFARDPEFADKKRNRENDYSHTVLRSLHEYEVKKLFDRQRAFGSPFVVEAMEERYIALAFDQLPLQDSEKLLGTCPFEPKEKRASSLSYSFELFRILSRLNNMRLHDGSRSGRRLRPEELQKSVTGFGCGTAKINFKQLKKVIGLPNDTRFVGVGEKDESRDIARASTGCAFGSNTLCKVLGEAVWSQFVQTPVKLDAIAHVLTFREDKERIRKGLQELGLARELLDDLMKAVTSGKFAKFSKAGHLSTRSVRNIIPGLMRGMVYSDACAAAGYNHSEEIPSTLEAMTNPVAKRAVRETLKQVNAMVRLMGCRPGKIHVELGRDVGKGPMERGRIERGIEDRTKARADAREAFCKLVSRDDCSNTELMRYEMWKEQQHFCMFCHPQCHIEPTQLLDKAHAVEIEHILPLSRSQDNSWHNKVLACVKCNREKRNMTPWEWFGEKDPQRWAQFEFRVTALRADKHIKGFKIRNLLMKDFAEREESFISRNLNDMRYAARVVLAELEHLYSQEEKTQIIDKEQRKKRRVFARSGQITAMLRRFWGLESTKYLPKDGKKKRIEDERHHAVDAIVVAACSEGTLQKLTRAIQKEEEKGLHIHVSNFELPWEGFRADVLAVREKAPVARTENRRGRGAGHEAIYKSVREEEGRRIAYQRKSLESYLNVTGKTRKEKLASIRKAMEKIKDPGRNLDTISAVLDWVDRDAPLDDMPRRNNGHPIKKVTLRVQARPTTEMAGFKLNGGLVANADMVRVDVFAKDGKYYLVPIYAHQVANRKKWPMPPNKAIEQGKIEADWLTIGIDFTFKFSLHPFSYVELVNAKGEVFEGYYRGTDRSTGALTISEPLSRQRLIRSIGARTLHSFKKFQIDRLGNKSEIKGEKRTWHGEVCT